MYLRGFRLSDMLTHNSPGVYHIDMHGHIPLYWKDLLGEEEHLEVGPVNNEPKPKDPEDVNNEPKPEDPEDRVQGDEWDTWLGSWADEKLRGGQDGEKADLRDQKRVWLGRNMKEMPL